MVSKDTIKNFVKSFSDPKIQAVTGNVLIGNTENIINLAQFFEFLNSFYTKRGESILSCVYIMSGAASAFRKTLFDEIGTYRENILTEDMDISMRIYDAGYNIIYNESAIIYTEGASDIGSLVKQRLRWKMGWFEVIYRYKHALFSLNKKHSKLLSWFLIPLMYILNIELLVEPWLVLYILFHIIHTPYFYVMLLWISTEVLLTIIAVISKKEVNKKFILLTPFSWLISYISIIAEHIAMILIIKYKINKRKIIWQRWNRSGLK